MSIKTSDLLIAPSRADADAAISGLARVLGRQLTLEEADFLIALAFACEDGDR